jgi:hypothetical protein
MSPENDNQKVKIQRERERIELKLRMIKSIIGERIFKKLGIIIYLKWKQLETKTW